MNYEDAVEQVAEDLAMQRMLAEEGVHAPLNVPFLLAPVGTGKSAMAGHFARTVYELPLVKINLGENSSGVEMTGLPDLMRPGKFQGLDDMGLEEKDYRNAKASRFTRWSFNEVIEHAINIPTFLFVDDADKAPPPLQSALLALTAERTVRDRKLHPKTLIMLAGNRVGDDILANEISESLLTRTTPMVLSYGIEDFKRFSALTGLVHPTVLGFVTHKPEYLHRKPTSLTTDLRFPTPRGWEEVSHHLFYLDTLNLSANELARRRSNLIARKVGGSVLVDWIAWAGVLGILDLDALYATGGIVTKGAGNPDMQQYLSVAAAVMLSSSARGKGVAAVPGLPRFLTDKSIAKESRVVCFSLLPEALRMDLLRANKNIDLLELFQGLGLTQ